VAAGAHDRVAVVSGNPASLLIFVKKRESFFLFAVAAVFVICAQPQFVLAQNYTFTDLGYPGNLADSASEAHGVNSNSFVVGTWWKGKSSQGSQYAFLYANGANTDLGTIKAGGYDYAIANAINNANQIVGQGTIAGSYNYHAFLYTNGVMVDLDNTGGSWSSANAINQRGQIAGEFTTITNASQIHAFIYTNGMMLDLGTLPGGSYSTALGINDSGVIVGQSDTTGGYLYAFVYSNGVMTSLGTLGGTSSIAYGINNAGVIVGQSSTTNGESHAFIFQNGIMSDLGTLGGTNSTANAINNGGDVVGYALTTNEDAHAFLFNGSAMLDLHTTFSHPPSWTNVFLTLAYAINDLGQVAGGINYVTNGITNYDAFLISPPGITLTCSTNITTTATDPGGAIVNFSVTATGGCSIAPNVVATPASGSLFPVGTNTVNVTASDLCGHTNTCNFIVVVNPPLTVSCSTNIMTTATGPDGANVTYNVSAAGGCSTPTVSAIPASGSLFPIGTNTVTVTASDSCQHTNTCSFTVTIIAPLTVSCSTNITARAPDSDGAQVFFNFSAGGGCSSPSVIANPPSGSMFEIGTNLVTVTANDACGNTNSCTFTVTVLPPLTPMTIRSPMMTDDGFQMTIQGVSGQNFSILTSTDLVNWAWLVTNTLISDSTNFVDPATNNSRFYRAATLP
jgi:probable HAF family extracellular repeat protein